MPMAEAAEIVTLREAARRRGKPRHYLLRLSAKHGNCFIVSRGGGRGKQTTVNLPILDALLARTSGSKPKRRRRKDAATTALARMALKADVLDRLPAALQARFRDMESSGELTLLAWLTPDRAETVTAYCREVALRVIDEELLRVGVVPIGGELST